MENSIKADTRNCKAAFINCSQTEDEALEYMIKCYTSKTQVQKNIQELLQIKDAATKLKTAQEAVVSSSKQANGNKRQKRQKNSEVVFCQTITNSMIILMIIRLSLVQPTSRRWRLWTSSTCPAA